MKLITSTAQGTGTLTKSVPKNLLAAYARQAGAARPERYRPGTSSAYLAEWKSMSGDGEPPAREAEGSGL